jgi:hypothetical protein
VRDQTFRVAMLMQPNKKTKVPPKVRVDWGAFSFLGLVDSYKETIDYFATDGTPLRASVSLSMSSPADGNKADDKIFTFGKKPDQNKGEDVSRAAVEATPPAGASATDVATKGGDPGRGKDVARQAGSESMRDLPKNAPLVLDDDEPELLDATAFASGSASASAGASFGASAGASAGASFGASAGASAGANASFGASAGANASFGASAGANASFGASAGANASFGASAGANASFGASAGANASFGASASASAGASFGASASAGVSASAGAFAGLRTPSTPPRAVFDPSRLLPDTGTPAIATANATFAVGGRVVAEGSASASARTSSSIRFDEDDF